jgi:signal transduction histidine kinase
VTPSPAPTLVPPPYAQAMPPEIPGPTGIPGQDRPCLSVDEANQMIRDGTFPGDVVICDPGAATTTTVIMPPAPTIMPFTDGELADALTNIDTLETVRPQSYRSWTPDQYPIMWSTWDWREAFRESRFGLLLAAIVLLGGLLLVVRRTFRESIEPLVIPIAAATAMPFAMAPLAATPGQNAIAYLAVVLLPFGMLPLAIELANRINGREARTVVVAVVAACAAGAVIVGALQVDTVPSSLRWQLVRLALVAAIPLIPGIAAAAEGAAPRGGRGLLKSTEFAVAGATPMMGLLTPARLESNFVAFPLSFWLLAIALAARFTIRPLTRIARRATLQRDLVVAATEAERARVAADIHDDALQELTLLVRRLDDAGDAEGAGMARGVSDRLRAICGDLRLPILDDLGVGPALEWLVQRVERLAGGEVRLERSDGPRLPPDIELAFFRIAQEALANAARHGKPPIVVRFRTSDTAASLAVDDAGPGIGPDASETAEAAGHFGLLNMAQRAEAIGAILDVRRWPSGGTHVALEWRAS